MRYPLTGRWRKGYAFDLHTLASTYLGPDAYGHDQFENERSEMGKLLYQLKYRGDRGAIGKIIDLLKGIRGIDKFDFLMPVPPSKERAFQPVEAIVEALGAQRGVPVLIGYLKKQRFGAELKNVDTHEQREKALKETIKIASTKNISGKSILLIDDLYRSGATLNACCAVLEEQARVDSICVLTMTKTRSKR